MFWFALCHLFSSVVDLLTVRHLTDAQKDIQILLLRQQVRVQQQKARQPKHFSRLEKTLLAVLVAKLRRTASDLHAQVQPVLIFSPDTVLRWRRESVRRDALAPRVGTVRNRVQIALGETTKAEGVQDIAVFANEHLCHFLPNANHFVAVIAVGNHVDIGQHEIKYRETICRECADST